MKRKLYCPECDEEKDYKEPNKISIDNCICPDCGGNLENYPDDEIENEED